MNPIITQPGYGMNVPQNSDWQTGTFDCFSDMGVCVCGTFCTMCLACQIASSMDECFLCGSTVAMRTLYRTRYRIPGSICTDCLMLWCFTPCVLCQLKRDIDRRKAMNAF